LVRQRQSLLTRQRQQRRPAEVAALVAQAPRVTRVL